VGGEYTAVFACVDELIPCKYRGRVDIIIDGTWHLGTFLASLIGLMIMGPDWNSSQLILFGKSIRSW